MEWRSRVQKCIDHILKNKERSFARADLWRFLGIHHCGNYNKILSKKLKYYGKSLIKEIKNKKSVRYASIDFVEMPEVKKNSIKGLRISKKTLKPVRKYNIRISPYQSFIDKRTSYHISQSNLSLEYAQIAAKSDWCQRLKNYRKCHGKTVNDKETEKNSETGTIHENLPVPDGFELFRPFLGELFKMLIKGNIKEIDYSTVASEMNLKDEEQWRYFCIDFIDIKQQVAKYFNIRDIFGVRMKRHGFGMKQKSVIFLERGAL